MVNSVYKFKYFMVDDAGNKYWHTAYAFYRSAIEFDKNDWRIKEVKGRKYYLGFMGFVDLNDTDFPINFPLKMNDGSIITNIEVPIEYINSPQ